MKYAVSIKNWFINCLSDVINFIFPIYCASCGKRLIKEFEVLCIACEAGLSKTNYHHDDNNPLVKKFWGFSNIEKATALYFYEKKGQIQNLLFHLKYKGNQSLGRHLGMLMANELKDTNFKNANYIIPVPLHPEKQNRRGYNQIHSFCEGFSEALDIKFNKESLYRKVNNPSQTKKNRIDRWENVSEIFGVRNMAILKNQDVILVDDVVTTGATVEACCMSLKASGVGKIYLVCIAVAS